VFFHGGFGGWLVTLGSQHVVLSVGADRQGRNNAIVVSIPDEITQRKGAKNAKPLKGFLIVLFGKLLCELCVFAVKTVFTDQNCIVEYGRGGYLVKSVSRTFFTDIMCVFSAFFASLR
jgi:hypothetical protein